MRKLKNDDRGVTLVEIIVSIAILAIIVLPFLNAFVTATKTNVKAKNEMNATHLATNIMEGIEKNSMKYNMDEVADMSAMDANFDCMCADRYSAINIIAAFNNMNPGLSVQQSDIKRTITIDIEKSGAASNKATKVTVSYSYSINKNDLRQFFRYCES